MTQLHFLKQALRIDSEADHEIKIENDQATGVVYLAIGDDGAVQSTSSQAVITKVQADSLTNIYNELSETGKAEFDGMMKGGSISNINAIPANFYNWAFSEITKIKNKELASNANS